MTTFMTNLEQVLIENSEIVLLQSLCIEIHMGKVVSTCQLA